MNRRLAGLAAFMRELGLDLSDFDQRLLTQKAVYLFQVLGVDLGYRYNWYLKGPYSPSLTQDAYAVEEDGIEKYETVRFKPEASSAVATVSTLLEALPEGLDQTRWAELLASMHFLKHLYSQKLSNQKIFAKLSEEKGFSKEQNEAAWEALDQVNLIEQKKIDL